MYIESLGMTAADAVAEGKTRNRKSVRKRSRSYRPRIHSFNMPFSSNSRASLSLSHHAAADPPSSPLSGSRSASDTDGANISTSTVSPQSTPPLYPSTPTASATYLTHSRIVQLSDQLARQSSQQLLTLTRTNTKKNAGPRPFAMAFNRVLRKMRFPPTAPTPSMSMPSLHSLTSSMSLSNPMYHGNGNSASTSAPASLPFRRNKTIPKVVSFSDRITILTAENQGSGEEEKWVDLAETKAMPHENGNICELPPKQDRARRIVLGSRRRTSFAERPIRVRSDITAATVKSPLAQLETMPRLQSLGCDPPVAKPIPTSFSDTELKIGGSCGLQAELRRKTARVPALPPIAAIRTSFSDTELRIESSSGMLTEVRRKAEQMVSCDSESESVGVNSDCESVSDDMSVSDRDNSVCAFSDDRNHDTSSCAGSDSDVDRSQTCIVNNRSARNLAYLYATTAQHSRLSYTELRVTKQVAKQ